MIECPSNYSQWLSLYKDGEFDYLKKDLTSKVVVEFGRNWRELVHAAVTKNDVKFIIVEKTAIDNSRDVNHSFYNGLGVDEFIAKYLESPGETMTETTTHLTWSEV